MLNIHLPPSNHSSRIFSLFGDLCHNLAEQVTDMTMEKSVIA
jgi:hypothetical protein